MLVTLKVRDIVLIDALDLDFRRGLSVLTGETGAGKTIILEALGFALGGKADRSLLRQGVQQGSVSASFDLDTSHPAFTRLTESGLVPETPLILRRTLGEDGRSRAYINDEPVSLALLRAIGEALVEVHGQFDDRGLLDPASHRGVLDSYAGAEAETSAVAAAHALWRKAFEADEAARADAAGLNARAEFLVHAEAELSKLAPQDGEETALAEERTLLSHTGQIADALNEADTLLTRDGGVESRIAQAQRKLERVTAHIGSRLKPALEALDRAAVELREAQSALEDIARATEFEPQRLELIEERLFALRATARKHNVPVDGLPALAARLREELETIGNADEHLARLRSARETAERDFLAKAQALSAKRKRVAEALDKAVARELVPLKLERTLFHTEIETLKPDRFGPGGIDRVSFLAAINPGAPPGPLTKIASGGELARFMLALKVVAAKSGSAVTLIFDEVDRGVGGAVAAAVGERLARLAENAQILVVTHSPQVAARGDHHFQVKKMTAKGSSRIEVVRLDPENRREEIARMLSGSVITDEARAAATSLLADRTPAPRERAKRRARQ